MNARESVRRAKAAAMASELRSGRLKLRDVLGLSDRELAALERVAEAHRRRGRLGDAMAIYGLLAMQDPIRGRYWREHAELASRTGQHAEAALSYEALALIEGREPESARREADCWAQLGQRGIAGQLNELAAAIETERGAHHGTD
jgi:hypothetical protein